MCPPPNLQQEEEEEGVSVEVLAGVLLVNTASTIESVNKQVSHLL